MWSERAQSERGQATVEWVALLLMVALVLVAAGHLASRADGPELGTTLAAAVIHPAQPDAAPTHPRPTRKLRPQQLSALPGPRLPALPGPRLPAVPGTRLPALPPSALAAGRDALRRAGRGAGVLWRRAWFACLVYERTRYAFRHPESRFPGYTLPYGVALRMINSCVSPVDLLSDLPGLDPSQ